MTDDLTRARAQRIAAAKSPAEIRSAIRAAAQFCPRCGRLLKFHTDSQLDECATRLGEAS